jgi:para-nitrobenzyl esterase
MLALLVSTGCKVEADANPVLTISGGQVKGTEASTPGVWIYKGIPYAAPPVGALRWKAPQTVIPWEGVKIADSFGAAAPQGDKVSNGGGGGESPGNVDYVKEFYQAGDPERSEDCLYLNVWTPAPGDTKANLPVAMWIHGGAYMQGFGHEIEFDGEVYAGRGVILVTLNYRLGILGFLAHPALSAENEQKISGNYGILDQMAALDWIRENIAQFGGNPDNITIFGQSAGAGSVQNLLASPLTKGKIAKAIIQSGGGLSGLGTSSTLADYETIGREIFEEAGITTAGDMRKLPYEELQKLLMGWMMKKKQFMMLAPVIDGFIETSDFSTAVKEGKIPPVPYMIGGTKDDMPFARVGQPIYDFSLELEKQGRQPAYVYDFRRELPGDKAGAFHSAELWYVFGTLNNCWRPMTEADYKLSNRILDYWTNFIKTGNPNTKELPEWPAYTEKTSFVMELNIN